MRMKDWSSDVGSSDLPEIERRLVDMQFPVEPAVGDEGREELVHIGEEVHPHLVRLEGSRDMIDPDANEARVRFAADIEIVLGHFLEHEIGRASCRERVCLYV